MVKLRFFRTLCITGQFVKLSFNTEDITYLELELKNKFSIPEPESSTSGWLSKIFHFRYFMVKYCSTVPVHHRSIS